MIISFWSRLLDFVSPRLCVVCGRRLTITEQVICASCNMHLPRTGFQRDPLENIMAKMFWGRIPVERAAALFYYEAGAQADQIVYDLKYHDSPEIGEMMGRLMAREFMGDGFFEGIDVIVPVPLSRKRQRQRGYNQSAELATGISEVTGLPVCTKAVRRTHFSKSQTQLHHWERRDNVDGAFLLKKPELLRNRHVLLVDDVVTTGATMVACVREILKAEGVNISLISLGFTKS
jgi:ComF family protein